jgi:DNA-binding HxlR family transcriptional regulator
MVLLDLLGRRWALRVLWELRAEEVPTFRELQARCGGISSSVLNERLRELRDAGIVAKPDGRGYHLTDDGRSLLHALSPIDAWAKRWAKRTTAQTVEDTGRSSAVASPSAITLPSSDRGSSRMRP